MPDQNPEDNARLQMPYIIDSRIWTKFFGDYGTVKSVSSDKTKVDVTHAVIGVTQGGDQLPAYVSKDVELLFISSAAFYQKFPISVGDPVLLIGLKDYVADTKNIIPKAPTDFRHYNQDTLKAIPLSGIPSSAQVTDIVDDNNKRTLTGPGFKVDAQGQKIALKNTAASVYTAINDFEAAVQTFCNATSQAAITSGGASSVSLAAAIVALMVTMNASITSAKTALSQVMEA